LGTFVIAAAMAATCRAILPAISMMMAGVEFRQTVFRRSHEMLPV
jgi:hypothetical protein